MTTPIGNSSRKLFLSGVLFLLFASVGWLVMQHSLSAYEGSPMRGDPGPFFLIKLCMSSLALLGIALALQGTITLRQSQEKFFPSSQVVQTAKDWFLPAAFVACLLLMPVMMKAMGTIFAVALFAIVWIYSLIASIQGHSIIHLIKAIAFGLGVAFFVELIFVRLLILPLP